MNETGSNWILGMTQKDVEIREFFNDYFATVDVSLDALFLQSSQTLRSPLVKTLWAKPIIMLDAKTRGIEPLFSPLYLRRIKDRQSS